MELKVSLLGPFAARLGDEPLADFRNRKTQALLIYLAVEAALPGRRREHQREQLMELLWPGLPQQSAQVNLRQTLYQLRQLAPQVAAASGEPVPLVLSDRQTVWLHPEATFELDVAAFLEAAGGDGDAEALAQAVTLYRGDFLSDFYLPDSESFEAWAAARRAEFRRLALEALAWLANHHLQRFEYAEAEGYARRQLELDNLRESAHRQLMEVLARQGQRSVALAQYDACRDLLRRELGVEPAAETEALYQAIRRGELDKSERAGRIRGYELKEKVGEGSYGAVYRAYQPAVDRDVAIKVIRPEYANDPDFIRRFEAEAQMVARLEHPRIVPLYDYWREPGGAYLVMRWLRGGSLKEALTDGPWPVARALPLVEQVAAALHLAHHHGVVHRDLKPANILLDEAGNAYLGDFGIARRLADASLHSDGFAGSPAYVSPEQLLSERVTPQSDIYTFGVVVYELLAGERPFAGESLAGILHKHLHEPLPSLQARRPELPPAVDEVIQQATAKQPAERYPDALAFAAALRQALAAEELHFEPGLLLRDVENPYKGLRAFEEADAPLFFGREALVNHLLTRLANGDAATLPPAPPHPRSSFGFAQDKPAPLPRFLAIVGPSGSGKSSVVKAGLIPALRQGALPGSEKWFIVEMMPGARPLEELEAALLRVAVNPPATLLAQLQEDERGFLRAVKRVLPGDASSELLLVIDQFEELFTLTQEQQEVRHFLDSLVTAAADPRGRIRVVVTLRADFYDRPLLIPGFSELMQQYTEVVVPLTAEELSRAIREPARRVGVAVEDVLLAEMVADVHEQPGALPLLQFALTELFEQRQGNRLTLAAYHAIGGVKGALGRRAEQLYQALDEAGQEAARQLFLRLVTLGEGVEDTRRRVLRGELEALGGAGVQARPERSRRGSGGVEPALSLPKGEKSLISNLQSPISNVVDVFGRHRLLSFDRDPATRGPTVEVAHEALLREWPRLRRWLEESRGEVRLQRLLAEAAVAWEAAGHDGSYLLRGVRLDTFERWSSETSLALAPSEKAYLDESLVDRQQRRADEEARQAREARLKVRARRVLQALVVVFALAALISGGLALWANGQRTRAEAAEEGARESLARVASQRLAAEANNLLLRERSPELAALLALQGLNSAYSPEADMALQRAAVHDFSRVRISDPEHLVFGARFSRDSRYFLTLYHNPLTARIYDAQTGEAIWSRSDTVYSGLAFDGSDLVTPDNRFLIARWGIQEALVPPLIIWSPAEHVGMLELATGEVAFEFVGHTGLIHDARLAFDGQTAITASQDGTVRIWDTATGQEIRRYEVEAGAEGERSAAISPDGRYHVAGVRSSDIGTVYLWDAATGQEIRRTTHDSVYFPFLNFYMDGRLLQTGCGFGMFGDGCLLWETETGEPFMPEQTAELAWWQNYSFTPDGTKMIWLSHANSIIKIWDSASQTEIRQFETIAANARGMALSPDGRYALTGFTDTTARVYDVETGEQVRVLQGHTATVLPIFIYSPDGQTLLTSVASQGEIRLWDAAPSGGARDTGLRNLAYFYIESPDHSLILTGKLSSGQESPSSLQFVDGQTLETTGAEIPDTTDTWISDRPWLGNQLLIGTSNGSIWRWSIPDGTELSPLEPPEGETYRSASVIPHTNLILATGTQGDYVLDAQTGAQIRLLPISIMRQDGAFSGLQAISDDGRYVAISASTVGQEDYSIILWDLQTGEMLWDQPMIGAISLLGTEVYTIDISPDNRYVAAGGNGLVAFVWDLQTGEQHRAFRHTHSELGLHFSPDGRYLATAGFESLVRIYDMETGQEVRRFEGPPGGIGAVRFSADGQEAYYFGFADGTPYRQPFSIAELTDGMCHRLVRDLNEVERLTYGLDDSPTCPKFQSLTSPTDRSAPTSVP